LEKPASIVAAIFAVSGLAFCAIPFINQVSIGPEGAKIITNLQTNSEEINNTLKAHGQNIERLKTVLDQALVQLASLSAASPGSITPADLDMQRFKGLLRDVDQSITFSSRTLEGIEARNLENQAIIEKLQ
jgi:hypothetical protein